MTISTRKSPANGEPPARREQLDPRLVLALAAALAGVCGVISDWGTAALVFGQVLALFTPDRR